jgi:hypothetical protein
MIGGTQYTNLQSLLDDKPFGQELARTKNPSETWSLLVSALDTNRAIDAAFTTWWQNANRCPFPVWAATNGIAR